MSFQGLTRMEEKKRKPVASRDFLISLSKSCPLVFPSFNLSLPQPIISFAISHFDMAKVRYREISLSWETTMNSCSLSFPVCLPYCVLLSFLPPQVFPSLFSLFPAFSLPLHIFLPWNYEIKNVPEPFKLLHSAALVAFLSLLPNFLVVFICSPSLFSLPLSRNWGRRLPSQSSLIQVILSESMHCWLGCWREGGKRRMLINQPNENILADSKTSYSHIKGAGCRDREGKEREMRWLRRLWWQNSDDGGDFKGWACSGIKHRWLTTFCFFPHL